MKKNSISARLIYFFFANSHSNVLRFLRYPRYESRPITERSCTLIESIEVICRERGNSYCTRWFSSRWLNPDCRFTRRTSFLPLWIHLGRILKNLIPDIGTGPLFSWRAVSPHEDIHRFPFSPSLMPLEIKNFPSATTS